MAYFESIPQSTDDPSASQPLILANFTEIATVVAVNHVAFNDGDQGKHKFLQMPEQASAPATAANEGGLYTKEENGASELFYREESSGTELQLTNAFTAATDGEVTFPGGLIMKWGLGSFTTSGTNVTITFGTAYPANVYSVQATLVGDTGGSTGVAVDQIVVTGFRMNRASGSISGQSFYWTAIGN